MCEWGYPGKANLSGRLPGLGKPAPPPLSQSTVNFSVQIRTGWGIHILVLVNKQMLWNLHWVSTFSLLDFRSIFIQRSVLLGYNQILASQQRKHSELKCDQTQILALKSTCCFKGWASPSAGSVWSHTFPQETLCFCLKFFPSKFYRPPHPDPQLKHFIQFKRWGFKLLF